MPITLSVDYGEIVDIVHEMSNSVFEIKDKCDTCNIYNECKIKNNINKILDSTVRLRSVLINTKDTASDY